MQSLGLRISIDRGGTFTDVHASLPGRDDIILKLLSVDPSNYADAPTEGIRRVLELATGHAHPRGELLDLHHVEAIRMGTTVGTNALLERKGAKSALLITKGFKDLLLIGTQSRPKIFDLSAARPDVLFERVIEVDERVTMEDFTENPDHTPVLRDGTDLALVQSVTGEYVRVLRRPDMSAVQRELDRLWAEGFRSISIVFIHSYAYPDHENMVGNVAIAMGFSVAISAALQPMIKAVSRGMSATADAYLTPVVKTYIDSISENFRGGLGSQQTRCEFMQSDGGLVDFRKFSGLKAILSGPAGGVCGYAQTSWDEEERVPVIGFDMGGTSTDVSRYAGVYEHVFETTTAGISIQSPQLDIKTVAAGGGSILFWRNGLFAVGPESASAHPGPACYRKGGPLTVTDANLFLGRIQPDYFPKMFGPHENEPLDRDNTTKKFQELTAKINLEQAQVGAQQFTPEEVAMGFLSVADEAMSRPIRALTEARGFETSSHHLACFGGAGGQHACSVAAVLDISRVIIHKYSSILSAFGMSLADVVHEVQVPAAVEFNSSTQEEIFSKLKSLTNEAFAELQTQGFVPEHISHEEYLNMRYAGSSSALMILGGTDRDFVNEFEKRHKREFGFSYDSKAIIVDDMRVRATGSSNTKKEKSPLAQLNEARTMIVDQPQPHQMSQVYFAQNGYTPTPIFQLQTLATGTVMKGPAIVIDQTQTIVVAPDAVANILASCVIIDLADKTTKPCNTLSSTKHVDEVESLTSSDKDTATPSPTLSASSSQSSIEDVSVKIMGKQLDMQSTTLSSEQSTFTSTPSPPALDTDISPIRLSIFGHQFMSVAEQMGRTLQKTAVSTNIKERLDFSCALFSPDGGLVANAPHVPVHLGSMQFAVQYQHKHWKGRLQDGDVLVSNHPSCGGTHLPDITVITPVFDNEEIVFYVASRGHHADIGGTLPGSMPPTSTELWQEGAAIESEKLVCEGRFNEEVMRKHLFEDPAQYDGCSGTRCLADNISDLKAQVAANVKGINLIKAMIADHGLRTVHKYMYAIQKTAEVAVRELLKETYTKFGGKPLEAVDYMDDGTPIALKITISPDGTAIFDFTGSGPEVYGNTNAPKAITNSAIIYCLRALISSDIPLNQGCLNPITIVVPEGTILSPSRGAGVVGGNVLTSQRLTDVVLLAFRACAASQGCCNNLTFGTGGQNDKGEHVPGFGYYETIAGGSGAGPTWKGESGVHTHMTNTRITDPEVFEKRYPALIRQFGLRQGSGGKGLHAGGDGVVRDIEFRVPVQCSILSERRGRRPYGLEGGGDGASGLNLVVKKDEKTGTERVVNLGSKGTMKLDKGDRIIIHTPGGGAWGNAV